MKRLLLFATVAATSFSGIAAQTGTAASSAGACTASTAACTEWMPIGTAGARSLIYRTYSLDRKNDRVRRALIMVHGTNRNPDRYFAPAEEFDLDTWREIMAVNLDGAFLVAQEIGARMARRRRGSIIQTASIYGVVGPDQRIYEGSEYGGRPINTPPVYSASKAGIVGLTRYWATYWGPRGVRVNTLTPGGVFAGQEQDFLDAYNRRVPMGRMAREDELDGAVLFLLSDASSYMTGANLVIDGGWTAW